MGNKNASLKKNVATQVRMKQVKTNKNILNETTNRSYLLPQFSSWSYDFIKDVFSYMRVHSTEWIIQQVHISVKIHRSRQTDTLFLTSAQVYTLDIKN